MTQTLVQRLREDVLSEDYPHPAKIVMATMRKAADEIERLQALVDRMLWSMQLKAEMDLLPQPAPEWPLCEKCQKRMIQVAHDTWEYNCDHGTPGEQS